MGIWIRSQDKRMLEECSMVMVENGKDGRWKPEWHDKWLVTKGNHMLGIYSTEEKALKVMDMIDNFKTIVNMLKIYDVDKLAEEFGSGVIAEYISGTFQMPQDEEV